MVGGWLSNSVPVARLFFPETYLRLVSFWASLSNTENRALSNELHSTLALALALDLALALALALVVVSHIVL